MNDKKAINVSAHEIQKLTEINPDLAIISINEEHEGLYPLNVDRNNPNVFTCKFTDIATIRYTNNGDEYRPISGETAASMVKFIEKNKDKNFIVHCHAGVSRSSSVCLFIHQIHEHELKENFWETSQPNKYVLGSLLLQFGIIIFTIFGFGKIE